ncbi:MAG: hypothetical protein ACRD2S_00330 [Terriglobales bacterium]
MTQMEVLYRYGAAPGEAEMRALDNVREVYGVRGIRFNEKERSVRVEFDASRFKEPVIAALLRQAGIDIQENPALA